MVDSRGVCTAVCFGVSVGCAAGNASLSPSDVHVDEVTLVLGVADEGRDPAVLPIDVDGEALCTGVLVASDAVLTARHCVTRATGEPTCPAGAGLAPDERDPTTLRVFSGNAVASSAFLAEGRRIIVPTNEALCGADVAIVLLDRATQGIEPVPVSEVAVLPGDHVRTVGFSLGGDGALAGAKLLREHVAVLDTTSSEFRVAEAPCEVDSGGPAFDERTGAILGVRSRAGPACRGAAPLDVYTRADAVFSLVEGVLVTEGRAAGAPRSTKPTTDIGAYCVAGAQCGAGACVSESNRRYCSRSCTGADRCPTHYKCERAAEGPYVCVER